MAGLLSNSVSFENLTDFDTAGANIAKNMNLSYILSLVLLGSVANLFSVYVIFFSKLRLQSTSQYLTALAITDTLFLFQLLGPWLSAIKVTSIFSKGGFCQVFVYLSYVSCCLSAWLVLAFTIERFIAVVYPLHRYAWCTVRRARTVILFLVIGAATVNLPILRFTTPSQNDCNIDKMYMVYAARFNLVDTIISFTVPSIMIVLLNIRIVVGVCRLERARRLLMSQRAIMIIPPERLDFPPSQLRVTRMLVIVSSVFVFFNMPAYTLRIIAYAYNMEGTADLGEWWPVLQQLALVLFHSTFGINFMLYCLTGQNFRRAVRQSIPCFRQPPQRRDAIRRPRLVRSNSISSFSAASYESHYAEAITSLPSPITPRSRERRIEEFIRKWNSEIRRIERNSPTDLQQPRSINARENIEMHNIEAMPTDMSPQHEEMTSLRFSAASYESHYAEATTSLPSPMTPRSRERRIEEFIRKWDSDIRRIQRNSPTDLQQPRSVNTRENIEMHNIEAMPTDM